MPSLQEAIGKFKDAKVAVLGDVMLDHYTFGEVERISQEASVPVVVKKSEKFTLGGAANVAHNLATLGATVWLGGTVGDDQAGALVLKLLRDKNIDAGAVVTLAGRPTIEKHRIIAGESHQLLRLDIEENNHLTSGEEARCCGLIAPVMKKCDVVIFSDYGKGYFSQPFAQEIIALAKAEKKLMLADFKPKNRRCFVGVDAVSPNLTEAREMTGLHEVEEIGPRLVAEFNAHVIVTRGGEGVSLFRRESASHHHVPGKKIKVFDVSGAGDTAIATLALGLTVGLDLEDAVTLANEAGTIVVQKPGTATLSREELASVLRNDNHVEGVAIVPKVWGYERWIENNEKYCCKVLGLKKGYQCSMHYHKNKDETFLVTEGHVRLELGSDVMHLRPGSFVRILQNTPHRFAGIDDSLIIEVSTHHEDSDSYRIEESKKMDNA